MQQAMTNLVGWYRFRAREPGREGEWAEEVERGGGGRGLQQATQTPGGVVQEESREPGREGEGLRKWRGGGMAATQETLGTLQ